MSGQKQQRVGVLAAGTLVSQLGEDLASAGEGAPDLQKRSWGQSCRVGALRVSQP